VIRGVAHKDPRVNVTMTNGPSARPLSRSLRVLQFNEAGQDFDASSDRQRVSPSSSAGVMEFLNYSAHPGANRRTGLLIARRGQDLQQ